MSHEGTEIRPLELAKQLFDPGLAEGFDFPVGGPEGNAPYISKTTKRKYAGWKVTGLSLIHI